MTEELKNAGYTIIERFPVGEQGFAIGHMVFPRIEQRYLKTLRI